MKKEYMKPAVLEMMMEENENLLETSTSVNISDNPEDVIEDNKDQLTRMLLLFE